MDFDDEGKPTHRISLIPSQWEPGSTNWPWMYQQPGWINLKMFILICLHPSGFGYIGKNVQAFTAPQSSFWGMRHPGLGAGWAAVLSSSPPYSPLFPFIFFWCKNVSVYSSCENVPLRSPAVGTEGCPCVMLKPIAEFVWKPCFPWAAPRN